MSSLGSELVGLIAGGLNIASTVPHLIELWRQGRRGQPDVAHVQGRSIQLSANLVWLAYAAVHDLLALAVTTGVMSGCLVAVVWQHSGHGRGSRSPGDT